MCDQLLILAHNSQGVNPVTQKMFVTRFDQLWQGVTILPVVTWCDQLWPAVNILKLSRETYLTMTPTMIRCYQLGPGVTRCDQVWPAVNILKLSIETNLTMIPTMIRCYQLWPGVTRCDQLLILTQKNYLTARVLTMWPRKYLWPGINSCVMHGKTTFKSCPL